MLPLGVIGGLEEPGAEADFLQKLAAAVAALPPAARPKIVVERCAHATRINILAAILNLAERGVGRVALPSRSAHEFVTELQAQSPLPIVAMRADIEYVQAVVKQHTQHVEPPARPFKLGVVGGVGPAATVDFLKKVVRNTPAHVDQDHLEIVVEQNPQIPDRTAHLLGRGPDPTLALYATCRRLQSGGASLIAIPCNTAHAYLEAIQPYLGIPILNMLQATVSHVVATFPQTRRVGLLATTGTLASQIYHRALESQGLSAAVPPPALQARMMEAIYGARGIKAGFVSGPCVEDIHQVVGELVSRGVQVVILGCTELPLVLNELTRGVGTRVTFVDPTDILAVRCVNEAHKVPTREANGAPVHAIGAM